ncbi:Uncharacterised protein [Mycobacteroides abscessus subsp. abscessus]|nr:Uncharacterised protein [Mycobacteroides abscessus subsp. abscessus]
MGLRAAEQGAQACRVGVGALDVAHRATLGHGVDDLRAVVEQARLQGARRHASRRRGEKAQALGRLAQGLRRALREQRAAVQHVDLRAMLRFVEVGGADQHAEPRLLDQLLDDLPQLAARQRIHAHGRFVQQQQVGRAHQGAGQPQLLLHAARQLAGRPLGKARQVGHGQQARVAFAALARGHAVQVGVQVEVFLHAEVFVQAEALRHVADAVLHRLGRLDGIDAQHAQRAGVGPHQARDQPQQGGLARAVGPDQRGQPAARDRQRQRIERERLAKALGQVPRLDDGRLVHAPGSAASARSSRTVAGMPRRSRSCGSSTRMRISYTRLVRRVSVCTVLGVNSATDEI